MKKISIVTVGVEYVVQLKYACPTAPSRVIISTVITALPQKYKKFKTNKRMTRMLKSGSV